MDENEVENAVCSMVWMVGQIATVGTPRLEPRMLVLDRDQSMRRGITPIVVCLREARRAGGPKAMTREEIMLRLGLSKTGAKALIHAGVRLGLLHKHFINSSVGHARYSDIPLDPSQVEEVLRRGGAGDQQVPSHVLGVSHTTELAEA